MRYFTIFTILITLGFIDQAIALHRLTDYDRMMQDTVNDYYQQIRDDETTINDLKKQLDEAHQHCPRLPMRRPHG